MQKLRKICYTIRVNIAILGNLIVALQIQIYVFLKRALPSQNDLAALTVVVKSPKDFPYSHTRLIHHSHSRLMRQFNAASVSPNNNSLFIEKKFSRLSPSTPCKSYVHFLKHHKITH